VLESKKSSLEYEKHNKNNLRKKKMEGLAKMQKELDEIRESIERRKDWMPALISELDSGDVDAWFRDHEGGLRPMEREKLRYDVLRHLPLSQNEYRELQEKWSDCTLVRVKNFLSNVGVEIGMEEVESLPTESQRALYYAVTGKDFFHKFGCKLWAKRGRRRWTGVRLVGPDTKYGYWVVELKEGRKSLPTSSLRVHNPFHRKMKAG
jgi:RecA/RadA recombinase